MPFPLPPTIKEQQRIVNRIESMFAKLDEAKEKAQNVVDSFETRKAAILHQAFTGNLTAKWRKENGISDDSWEEKRFDEFCLLKRGFDLPASKRISGEFPLVSSSGIIDTHNESKVKAPGVVTGRSGSIGKVFYIEKEFFPLNTTLYSEKLFGNNAKYVYYYFLQFDFQSYSSSTAVPTLNRNQFSSVPVQVPTFVEQLEIVRILDTVLEKENIAKAAAEQVLGQIDLLKKSILARAFRGEL
jgi:type I restriction enzyme S subunit